MKWCSSAVCPFPASSLYARICSRRRTCWGSFHHDPFLVAGVELVHEESWKINVDRLIWALETLALDDHSVVHYADVVDFLKVVLLMYRIWEVEAVVVGAVLLLVGWRWWRLCPWFLLRRADWRGRCRLWPSGDDRRWLDGCCLLCAIMCDVLFCSVWKSLRWWWWHLPLHSRLWASRRRSGRRRRSCSSSGLARPLASRGCRLPPAFSPLLVMLGW